MNRKISVGLTIAIAALAAVIAFFVGTQIMRDKVNQTLIDVNEKQAMYSKLYEIDQCVRANKESPIDEKALMEGICKGYFEGLGNSEFSYYTAKEMEDAQFAESLSKDENSRIVKLSDGSAVVINISPNSDKNEDGNN